MGAKKQNELGQPSDWRDVNASISQLKGLVSPRGNIVVSSFRQDNFQQNTNSFIGINNTQINGSRLPTKPSFLRSAEATANPYAYPIQNLEEQAMSRQNFELWNKSLNDLIPALIDQLLLLKKSQLLRTSRSFSGKSSDSVAYYRNKLSTLNTNRETAINSHADKEKGIAEEKQKRDKLKIRRRYLKAKQTEAKIIMPQMNYMLKQISDLQDEIRRQKNELENKRFLTIGKQEKEMRTKAELEAMKAAFASRWVYEDTECMNLGDRVRELEGLVSSRGAA